MHIRNSLQLGKAIKIIYPGELYVSNEDEIIGTLLGSCVSVCLIDCERGIAGMNHFMLPGKISRHDIFKDRMARYGITAIYNLMKEMEMMGSRRRSWQAKLFGGGRILNSNIDRNTIPDDNIRVARVLLEMEDIPIVKSDVGGEYTRKLLLEVKTGKVFLKKTVRDDAYNEVAAREDQYHARCFVDS
ncbi:MAG: chemotaxis protein CheD [Spirochaetes bacterium]|nr:chemotaxis protein CheD [Spirochaetota bacterium]